MSITRALIPWIIGVALVAALSAQSSNLVYPFATDGVVYLQQAQSFLDGQGFRRVPTGLSEPNLDLVPSSVFPPGYPMLIVLTSLTGVPPRNAATLVSWVTWGLVGGALLFTLRPLTGSPIAAIVALLTVISPGAFEFGYLAGADTPFLLCVVLSLGLLFRSISGNPSRFGLMLSGFLAGFAYLVRNAGLAVFPAVGIMFIAAWARDYLPRRQSIHGFCLWSLGSALILVPLALRNILVFGKVQPYFGTHDQSDFSVLRSLRTYLWSLLLDATASYRAAEMAWDRALLVFLALPAAVLLGYGICLFYRRSDGVQRLRLLCAGCYVGFGSAMVIAGRASFDWVETDLVRHVLQYSWLVLAGAFLAIQELLRGSRALPLALGSAALLLLISRAAYIRDFIYKERGIQSAFASSIDYATVAAVVPDSRWVLTNQLMIKFSRERGALDALRQTPPGSLVVSNYGKLLALECGRPVRDLPLDDLPSPELFRSVEQTAAAVSSKRQFFWALLPTNRVIRKVGVKAWQDGVIKMSSKSFSVMSRTPTLLLLRYRGNESKTFR